MMNKHIKYTASLFLLFLAVGELFCFQRSGFGMQRIKIPSFTVIYQQIAKMKQTYLWNSVKSNLRKNMLFATIATFPFWMHKAATAKDRITDTLGKKVAGKVSEKLDSAIEERKKINDANKQANLISRKEQENRTEKIDTLQKNYDQQRAQQVQNAREQAHQDQMRQMRTRMLEERKQQLAQLERAFEDRTAQRERHRNNLPASRSNAQKQREELKAQEENAHFTQNIHRRKKEIEMRAKEWGIKFPV